uniref:Uncharacterized protein n=1 Tax=viral metagenome TaxID=1070528 RepID=A0A6C0DSK4_9ZZZZ
MAAAHPDPIVLEGDSLAYWYNASGLIHALAENEGITAENLGEQKLVLKYEDMRLPNGMADWQLLSDLVEGHMIFSLNSKEKRNAATLARRAAPATSVHNIITREELVNNIDFEPSSGFTKAQALEFLDYLGYKTPRTMMTGLFADFGSPSPVLGHIPAAARQRPVGAAAGPPGRLNHRYNNNNGDRHGNNNDFEYNNAVNQNAENYAARRRGNREFQMEQLGRHGAAAERFLNHNNNNWSGARPGKGKRRGGTRKGKKAGRKTRRA